MFNSDDAHFLCLQNCWHICNKKMRWQSRYLFKETVANLSSSSFVTSFQIFVCTFFFHIIGKNFFLGVSILSSPQFSSKTIRFPTSSKKRFPSNFLEKRRRTFGFFKKTKINRIIVEIETKTVGIKMIDCFLTLCNVSISILNFPRHKSDKFYSEKNLPQSINLSSSSFVTSFQIFVCTFFFHIIGKYFFQGIIVF